MKTKTQIKVLPPRVTLEAYDVAREKADYDTMRWLFRQAHETATTLSDAMLAIQTEKVHSNLRHAPRPEDFPVYTMTSGGKLWKWNCGWWPMDKSGKELGPPIGWSEFRKLKVAKKSHDRQANNWLKLSRPDGAWRRHIDCTLSHPLFGNGKVILTDGVHALFEITTAEGNLRRVEVSFSALTEIAVPIPRKAKSVKPVNKSPKEKKMSEMTLDLL